MITAKMKINTTKLDMLERNVQKKLKGITKEAADDFAQYMRDNWSGHVPPRSSPGQPPAIETYELDESIKVEQSRDFRGRWESGHSIIIGAAYAAALEFGYTPINLLPRPFIRPAQEYIKGEYPNYFKQLLEFD